MSYIVKIYTVAEISQIYCEGILIWVTLHFGLEFNAVVCNNARETCNSAPLHCISILA